MGSEDTLKTFFKGHLFKRGQVEHVDHGQFEIKNFPMMPALINQISINYCTITYCY